MLAERKHSAQALSLNTSSQTPITQNIEHHVWESNDGRGAAGVRAGCAR
jgi:hypothetical protein